MGPSRSEPPGSQYGDQRQTTSQTAAMSSFNHGRVRNDDSWIDISSQPSSSLLTSASPYTPPQRSEERDTRPARSEVQVISDPPRPTSASGSSQDEYEESSSESDPILSSSNEDISREEEEDDDRTALGLRPAETVFTPPANAFSHPPSSRRLSDTHPARPNSTPSSAIRSDRARPHLRRERTSGSHQPDHDAALRASLTTLLSVAAAVRPKAEKAPERTTVARSSQPTALQLIPESGITRPRSPKAMKRRSRESSKERHAKKVRATKITSTEEVISPTLASWMISAGFVILFSAISFSAGYAWGKEVGRLEGEMGLTGGSCSQEAMKSSSLRRIRWTAGNSSIRA